MDYYSIVTILIVLSAFFGFINVRFLKLPITIGLMLITIVFTIIILAMIIYLVIGKHIILLLKNCLKK